MQNEENTMTEAPKKVSLEKMEAAANKLHELARDYDGEVAFVCAIVHETDDSMKVSCKKLVKEGGSIPSQHGRMKWAAMCGLISQALPALNGKARELKRGLDALVDWHSDCEGAAHLKDIEKALFGRMTDEGEGDETLEGGAA